MHNIFHIADYVVDNYSDYPGGITPMKLQKLLYYLKAWGIVAEVPVVSESFKKWKYGPVNHEIYVKYQLYGAQPIAKNVVPVTLFESKEFVDFVLQSYVPYSALTLSALTHEEMPWQQTEINDVINDELIKSYYKSLHFAKNFPLKPGAPYYPVLTDMYFSFIMDMDQTKVKPPVYPSFEYYKTLTGKAQAEIAKAFQSFLKSETSR